MTDEQDELLSAFASKLTVPTHPHHHLDADPSDQPEYANPVTANNYEVLYANALMELTDRKVRLNTKLLAAKKTLTERERALDRLERRLLRSNAPTSQTAVKTLKMQAAYIDKIAEQAGRSAERDELIAGVDAKQDEIDDLRAKIENASDWIKTITVGGDHIKTFLAFWKSEFNRTR